MGESQESRESLFDRKLKLDEMLEDVNFLISIGKPHEAYSELVSAESFAKSRGLFFDLDVMEDYEAEIASLSIKKAGEHFQRARECAEAGYYIETRDNLAKVCSLSNTSGIVLYEDREANRILDRAYKNNITNLVDSVRSSLMMDINNYEMAKFYHDSGREFLKSHGKIADILKFELATKPYMALAFLKGVFNNLSNQINKL